MANFKKGPFGSSLKLEMFVKEDLNTTCVYEQRNVIEQDNKNFRYFLKDTDAARLKSFNCRSGDILVTCAGTIGEQYALPNNSPTGIFNQALMRVRLFPNINKTIFSVCFNKMISYSKQKYSNGSAIKNIPPLKDLKNRVIYLPEPEEQNYISNFIEILSRKINILDSKISALKKYKRGLIQKGLKLLLKSSVQVPFINLFEEQKERNISNFKQYTVGKDGLKKIEETNYELSNHLVFHPNCLLVGIGIDEIAISENITGSVSPVYKVYAIDDFKYVDYCKYYLKPLLWKRKAIITKKSTRREFEIDINELRKMKLPACNNEEFKSLYKIIRLVDNKIDYVTHKYKFLIKLKNYLLQNLFI